MTRKKVGLALGSGAALGMAHVGVLKALERGGIPIHLIAGTSAGALVGALYARGRSVREIENLLLEHVDWKKLPRLIDLILPRTGFIAGRRLSNLIKQVMGGDLDFAGLNIPLACVATDIDSGEEVILRQGSVAEAVRASISIPGIFALADYGGRHLVDGSLTTPVPVCLARDMGADCVIAVNVLPERPLSRVKDEAVSPPVRNIFNVLLQSVNIATHQYVQTCLKGADFVIAPKVGHIGVSDFTRARELFMAGEAAAMATIEDISRQLAGA